MRVFIPLLLLLFVACTKPEESTVIADTLKKEKPNRIVLIFHKPVLNGFYTLPGGSGQSTGRTNDGDEIQYIDDDLIPQRSFLHPDQQWDTLTLHTQRDWMEVKLMYHGIDDLAYFFENGDSVVFKYDGERPVASVLNRQEAYDVTNYSLMVRDSLSIDIFPAMKIAYTPFAVMHRMKETDDFGKYMDKVHTTALANMAKELDGQYETLEQFRSTRLITDEQLQYRLRNIYYGLQHMAVNGRRNPERSKVALIDREIDKLVERFPGMSTERSDSLLVQMNYLKYLHNSIAMKYNKEVGMLERNGKGAGARIPDLLKKYDVVRLDSQLTAAELKTIQFGNVSQILENTSFFSIEQRLRYLNRFKNDFQDTIMMQSLIAKYDVEFVIDE